MTPAQSRAPLAAGAAGGSKEDALDNPRAGLRALRGGSLRTVGYVLAILISLISAPLLIRHLGIELYGRYMAVIAVVSVVSILTEGGLNAVALRSYATTEGRGRSEMMREALGMRLLLTTAGALIAIGFSAAAGYGDALVLGTALAGVAMLLQLVQALLGVSLESDLRFGWMTVCELLRQTVNVALLVALILAGAGVVPLLGAAVPASAASLILTVWLVRGRLPMQPAFHVKSWWPMIRESLPWAAVAAANVVYFRFALILMSLIATRLQTGYFATSMRVMEVLVGIPSLALGAAFPILARTVDDDGERFRHASRRLFELALVVGTWLVICVEVGAPFVLHVLADGKGDPSIPVLRIQGIAVIATFVAVGCGLPLLMLRRFRVPVFASVIALALSGVLTAILVGPLGARGAAVAAACAEFALGGIQLAWLVRVAPEIALDLLAVPFVALAGGAAVAVGLVLPVHPVIAVIVASAVYALMLRLLGRFPPEARELFTRRAGLAVR